MYGIVEVSGHQYKVNPGSIIDVQKLEADPGTLIDLEQVLFLGGENVQVGNPQVSGAKVKAKIIRQDRSEKILMVRRKAGKWSKKRGHRQSFTSLLITEITDGHGNMAKIDSESKEAKKYL